MSVVPKLQVPIAALIAGFSLGISRHILPVVYPSMHSITGTMNYHLGMLTSSYYFTYMVFALVFGSLSDRLSSRLILTTCCLLISGASLGMGICKSVGSLLIFSIVSGVGAGGLYVPMVSLLLKRYHTQRGFIASLVLTGEGVSAFTMGIVIPYIVSSLNWRYVWWLFGFIGIFFSLYLRLTIDDVPLESTLPFDTKSNRTILNVIKLKKIWPLGFIYFFHAITRTVVLSFTVAYLIKSGFSFTYASTAFTFLAVGMIPGSSLSGILSDRFNNRSVLMTLFSLQITCVVMLLLKLSYVAILLFLLVEGFCIGGVPILMGILPANYFTKDIYGKVLGFLTLMLGLGVSISPLIGGYIGDATGSLSAALLFGLVTSCVSLGLTILKL
jgi:sugar phosphate permease